MNGFAAIGPLFFRRVHADGQPVAASLHIKKPEHEECFFWICTLQAQGANGDYYFGNIERET